MKKVTIVFISISIALVLVGTIDFFRSESSLKSYLLMLSMAALLISSQVLSFYEYRKSQKIKKS